MEWCRLYGRFYLDPAVQRAGEKAEVLFIRGLAYCAAAETDGFIPRTQLPMFGLPGAAQRARSLVGEGLWLEVDDGWQVTRWRDLQEPPDVDQLRRESNRDRQRKWRAAQRAKRESNSDRSVTVTSYGPRDSHGARVEEKRRESTSRAPAPSRPLPGPVPQLPDVPAEVVALGAARARAAIRDRTR